MHVAIELSKLDVKIIEKTVSGSTSPTARRLEYPYSYDSASKCQFSFGLFTPLYIFYFNLQMFVPFLIFSWFADGERWARPIECNVNTISCIISIFNSTALHVTSAAFLADIEASSSNAISEFVSFKFKIAYLKQSPRRSLTIANVQMLKTLCHLINACSTCWAFEFLEKIIIYIHSVKISNHSKRNN